MNSRNALHSFQKEHNNITFIIPYLEYWSTVELFFFIKDHRIIAFCPKLELICLQVVKRYKKTKKMTRIANIIYSLWFGFEIDVK